MNPPKEYHLFISHSWTHEDAYENLLKLLKSKPGFRFRNHSVSKDDPIHTDGTTEELRGAISRKMQPCNAVLILAGAPSHYSKWIRREVEVAKLKKKSMIAIVGRGSKGISQHVEDNAKMTVGWNVDSIVSAIRELA